MLNDLYVTDCAVWLQTSAHVDRVLPSLANAIGSARRKLSKRDAAFSDLEIAEFESAAKSAQQETLENP